MFLGRGCAWFETREEVTVGGLSDEVSNGDVGGAFKCD